MGEFKHPSSEGLLAGLRLTSAQKEALRKRLALLAEKN